MTTATVYNVTGYYSDETPDDLFTVCMFSGDDTIEELGGFTDDDIFFYGVSAESLDAAIRDKEELGGFIPTSWEINSVLVTDAEPPNIYTRDLKDRHIYQVCSEIGTEKTFYAANDDEASDIMCCDKKLPKDTSLDLHRFDVENNEWCYVTTTYRFSATK